MRDLTEKQQAILEFIEVYIQEQGYPPTIREIGERFAITAKGAYDHLKAIEKKGYIKCEKNRSRAIELLKKSNGAANMAGGRIVNIPLVGRVAAGRPILAEENIEEYIAFPRSMLPREEGVFALRVAGDSMKDAGIMDGDVALIHKQEAAGDGDIVVALIDDEATLKYFYREKKRIRLQPANKAYKPLFVTDATILGKLVGIYRHM
ncbi:MAG: transcriptional repressor LexA [Leptospirales bacterium]|nr:transcriptional repressor LexA [Leptospirales bacterium]